MGQPTSREFRRLAARLAELTTDPAFLEGARSSAAQVAQARALRRLGLLDIQPGPGPDGLAEIYALDTLVRLGEVGQSEADAYLAQLRPSQQWAGRQFGGLADDQSDAALLDREGRARRRGGREFVTEAQGSQSVVGRRFNRGTDEAAAGAQPHRVPRLPDSYERIAVQRALEAVAEQSAQHVRQVRTRPPEFPAHSIDGIAIRPGSLPMSALAMAEAGSEALALPRAEEAVELELVHATDLDGWVVNGTSGIRGPGRIWRASDVLRGRAARVGAGAVRYRLVPAGTRFGVMSMRLPPDADMAATVTPGLLVQWGIVIARVPNLLGHPPSRILLAEAVGDAPTSLRTAFLTGGGPTWNSGGTTRNYFWNRTQSEHLDIGAFPFAEAIGTDAVLAPDLPALRDLRGFSFELVTGRTGGEVFRQLCSRQVLGRVMRDDAHGPGATVPNGLELEAPAPPTVVDWLAGPPSNYTHRVEGYDLTTVRVANGIPFTYDDCEALVADDAHFSVVVQAVGERLVAQAPAPTYGTPEQWHLNGFRTVEATTGRQRTWALDIIVE